METIPKESRNQLLGWLPPDDSLVKLNGNHPKESRNQL
jgi:hypothetical protein